MEVEKFMYQGRELTEEEIEWEINRQERNAYLPHESQEWENWGIEGAQSFTNLIAKAADLETNAPNQNLTIQKALHIIFVTIERQQLEYCINSNNYYVFFSRSEALKLLDFEVLQGELIRANTYKEAIKRDPAFNAYTAEKLKQGFDAKGNLTDNSPFKQDFMQAFHALQAHAQYAATTEYIAIIQKVIESIPDANKEKECPIIWERLKEEWRQVQERLSYPMKIPLPKITIPKTHTSPNTRVSNELDNLLNEGAFDLRVGEKRKRNELTAYVAVNLVPGESVHLFTRDFTEYDRQVYDAVVSLWMYGHEHHIITPATIFKAMTGANVNPSQKQKEAVIRSIEKMRRIFAEIDATDEVKAYLKRKGIEPTEKISLKWNDTILSLRGVKMAKGKEIIEGYIINNEPLLLSYAKATNKLLTSPIDLLDIRDVDKKGKILDTSLSNTQSRIAIKGYLWRRIMIMKHDQKTKNPHQSKVIRFNDLFTKTELQNEDRVTMRRNRDYVFQVLAFWKASGFIKDYRKNIGNNKVIESVEIKL